MAHSAEMSVLLRHHMAEDFLQDVYLTRFCAVSAAAVTLWDHILTFHAEIELLRERKWSFGKILFLLNRYWALATLIFNVYAHITPNIDDHFCKRMFQWQAGSGVISLVISHIALQLRLYALYDLDKALLAVTVPISGLTVVFAVAVHVWALAQGKIASHEIPGMPYCVSRGIPATYWILWLPIIAFEACLLGLVVRRAVIDDYAEVDSRRRASIDSIEQLTKPGCAVYKQHVRNPWRRATRVVELVAQTRRIFYVLVRDSVVYFFVMFASYVTNLIVWATGTVTTLEVSIPFSVALACVLCSRMLLNVREQAEAPRRGVDAPGESFVRLHELGDEKEQNCEV